MGCIALLLGKRYRTRLCRFEGEGDRRGLTDIADKPSFLGGLFSARLPQGVEVLAG